MSRSLRSLLIVTAVAVLAAGCSSDDAAITRKAARTTTTAAASDAPAADPDAPVDETIEAEIDGQGLTVDRARALYSAVVAPLPGVDTPTGPAPTAFSGTRALGAMLSVYDELTADQQQVVLDHLGVGGPAEGRVDLTPVTDPPDPRVATPDAPSTTFHGRSAPERRDNTDRDRTAARRYVDVPASFFAPYATWANAAIAGQVGAPQIPKIRLHVDSTDTPSAIADTIYFDKTDIPLTEGKKYIDNEAMLDACLITLYTAKFDGFDPAAITSVLAHEVFHCYQQRQVGTLEKNLTVKPWLQEGEATWVMMELVPDAALPELQTHWTRYISTPQHRALFTRRYDAVGFYGHIEDMQGPGQIWPNLLPAYQAGVGGADETAFGVLVQGVEDVVMDFWGASYWRSFPDKVIWDMLGPGKPNMPSSGAAPEKVAVGPSAVVALPDIDPYENLPVQVVATTEIVEVVNGRGHLAVAAGDSVNDVIPAGSSVFYCVQEEPCVCPTGTTGNPPDTVATDGSGLALGLTGARTGFRGQVRGYALDDFCKDGPKAPGSPPKRGGGGGGDAGSSTDTSRGRVMADPHLVTFDGRRYDLQAKGEFTLVRSTVDDLVVQVRFAALYPGVPATNATAVATRVGNQRVTFASGDPDTDGRRHLTVRVDGAEAPLTALPKLTVGSLRRIRAVNGESVDLTYPDGTVLRLRLGAALDVSVVPAAARAGKLTGLLGDFDGVATDEPTIGPDGPVLSTPPSYEATYQQLAPAWRIAQAASLFDYGPGESTDTFTDPAFPDRTLRASDQAIADARAYCTALGITDPGLLDDCVFDEANTHDRRTAFAYQEEQRFAAWAATPPGEQAEPSGPATTYDGSVTSTKDRPTYEIKLKKGDIVDIGGDESTCRSDSHLAAQLVDPTGLPLTTAGDVCAVGRIEAKVKGTYQLIINSLGEASTGTFSFAVTPVRPDRRSDLAVGGTLSGSITQRAEHDIWRFKGAAGQTLSLAGTDCVGPVGVQLVAPDGTLEAPFTLMCDMKDVVLRSSGPYELVVNADSNRTGDYTATLTAG